jgi:hypothetical protein
MSHDPGVVDHHVERAQLTLGSVEESGEGGAVGHVERQGDRAAAQLSRRALGQLEIEVADRDAAALAHQCRRGRLADPPRTAGDRHDLATEGLPLLRHRDLLLGDPQAAGL